MPRQPSTSPLPQDLGASPSPTRPHRAVRGLDENGSHLPVTLQRPRRKTAAPLPAEGQGRTGTSDSRLSAQGPGPGPCGPFLSPGDCAHQCDRKYSGRVLQTQVRIPAVPLPPGETSDRGCDLPRLLPHLHKEAKWQEQGQTPPIPVHSPTGHWKPPALGDTLL